MRLRDHVSTSSARVERVELLRINQRLSRANLSSSFSYALSQNILVSGTWRQWQGYDCWDCTSGSDLSLLQRASQFKLTRVTQRTRASPLIPWARRDVSLRNGDAYCPSYSANGLKWNFTRKVELLMGLLEFEWSFASTEWILHCESSSEHFHSRFNGESDIFRPDNTKVYKGRLHPRHFVFKRDLKLYLSLLILKKKQRQT